MTALGGPPRGVRPGSPDERGSATLFAVACLGVLLLLGAALGVVAALFVAHRSAQSAADLAALAAAGAAARGQEPCASAAAVAEANRAGLDSCAVAGREVVVGVVVSGPRWLGQRADLQASARAGPG